MIVNKVVNNKNEIDRRLDALFDESSQPAVLEKLGDSFDKDPLVELKSLLLSIDWEINDKVLAEYLTCIDSLKELYTNDKIVFNLLQILEFSGRYIQKSRIKAHPNIFGILNSSFLAIETITLNKKISPIDKQNLFKVELGKYRQFRTLLAKNKNAGIGAKIHKPIAADSSKNDHPEKAAKFPSNPTPGTINISEQHFIEAINDIKQLIISEINSLRKEIKCHEKHEI